LAETLTEEIQKFSKRKWELIGDEIGLSGKACQKRAKKLNLSFK